MPIKVNDSKTLYHGRVFKLVSENITLAGGVEVDMDIIRHPGAAAIVPLSRKNTVILIKQYRHAVRDYIWEIPAGTLNMKETAIECAKRELREETGYIAENWHKLTEILPVPGYSDERIHIFLAGKLSRMNQDLDVDEVLEVYEFKIGAAMEMIFKGEICDGKSIAGLFMALHWLKQNGLP
ncbi:MAG: NUDIX hydrolase [Desulfobacterales bacterium]|nr:NUDIX hydrolase [Desulfobacterales bacterium]